MFYKNFIQPLPQVISGFTTLLVANVSNDGILGLDNLSKMGAKIDLTNFQISTEWGNVDCVKEDGESLISAA